MALLVPGMLLVTNVPTASAADAPYIGRVTVSGPDILVDGVDPVDPFFGVCDTTAIAFAIDNYINGNRGVAGWTSVFNGPDTGARIPVTPNDTPDAFWNQYFAQMASYDVNMVRIGPHDIWGSGMSYNAWTNHQEQYYDLLHSMAYYAQVHGIWLTFCMGGSQEFPAFQWGGDGNVFVPGSSAYNNYIEYAKSVMVELEHENAIAFFDMFNEPDHDKVSDAYWQGNKQAFNDWANSIAADTAGVSTHPRMMGVAGFGKMFGMNQADFNLATGNTDFEVLHRHYYGSNTDPYNFVSPEQWADQIGKPLFWGELANNGPYPLVRYDFAEKQIWAAGGQAITSMVLTGTPGYPYGGGAVGQGQVPMPADWTGTVQKPAPTPQPTPVPVEDLRIVSSPSNESKVGVPYKYKVETNVPASIEVSTDAAFLGFNLADSTLSGTPGMAGNYSVTVRAYLSGQSVEQKYALTVVEDRAIGNVTIEAVASDSGSYAFSYDADLNGEGVASVSWNFGDGNVSSDAAPSHQFAAGDHLVALTVTGQNGTVLSTTYAVHVAGEAPSGVPANSGNHTSAGAVAWGSADSVLMVIALVCATMIGLLGYMGMTRGVDISKFDPRPLIRSFLKRK